MYQVHEAHMRMQRKYKPDPLQFKMFNLPNFIMFFKQVAFKMEAL